MDRRFLLKAALSVALCNPLGGVFQWLTPQARAQAEAFPLGTEWADMLDPAASLAVVELPTHPLDVDYTYHGLTAPTYSQMVRTNGDGCVLFFGQDGNLYDHDGYLMADVRGGDECWTCLEPGVMEMISVPVPGYCNLYYIFVSHSGSDMDLDVEYRTRVQVAILDLAAQNHWFPERKGALINLGTGTPPDVPGISMEILDDAMAPNASDYVRWLGYSYKGVSNTPMLRAIDPTGAGQLFWLYVVGTQAVVQFKIDVTGIHLTATDMAEGHYQPTRDQWWTMGDKAYYRDAAVTKNSSNQVLLAMTDDYLQGWNGTFSSGHGPVLIMKFNGTTGALIDSEEIPFGTGGLPDFGDDVSPLYPFPTAPGAGLTGGPGGIAWVNNGTRLLIQGEAVNPDSETEWQYHIGTFDLDIPHWTDLTTQLNAQNNAPAYSYTRLSANTVNGGVPAFYVPHATGLGRFSDLDGIPAWTTSVSTTSDVAPPEFAGYTGDVFRHPHFINAQVTDDAAHIHRVNFEAACCEMWDNYLAYPGHEFGPDPAIVHWYPYQNPFGNCGEVTFTEDVVVPPWIDLHIHDMTLKFAPEAHFILQAGAYVSAEHTDFVPSDCLGLRWQGIRVEGDPTNPTQNDLVQGRLALDHCLVEEAYVGVWCAREGESGHGGGIISASYSTFMECIEGVRIEQYHRIIAGNEQPNKCVFNHVAFGTTFGWPDLNSNMPKWHALLWGVNGVKFNNCSFRNSTPVTDMPLEERGLGIVAIEATFKCNGLQNYTANFFSRLRAGVLVVNPDPLFPYEVRGMAFDRNLVGLYDMLGTNSVITNNKFTAMTSTVPLDLLSIGMYMDQSLGYTVERNYFQDIDQGDQEVGSVGIWFHGPQPAENRIYDNEFHDLTIGNVAEGVHNGTFNGMKTGLQWLCGLYVGEVFDQLLLSPGGTIKQKQGDVTVTTTAGNIFQGTPDCQTTYEPAVFLDHSPFPIDYYYYSSTQSPESKPECIEDEFGDPIAPVGLFYSLDPVDGGSVAFDPNLHCTGGVLDTQIHGVLFHKTAYEAKYAELQSAVEAYEGNLDHGLKDDLMDAIKADPPWPSHQLRTYLLSQSPLSEEVIIAAIDRVVPMDPWHLSQVLIANSRLSRTIWTELDHTGILSPFFYNMVREHELDPSFREVLQAEVDVRAYEKDREQRLLVLAFAEDSTFTGKLDTLMAIYAHDTLGYGQQVAYRLALSHHRPADITALAAQLHADTLYDLLRAFGSLQVSLNYDWSSATGSDLAQLANMAWSVERLGRAAAWGTLYALGATDSLPNGILPREARTMLTREQVAVAVNDTRITAYPNPAKDRMMITYPAALKGGTLEVIDGRGGIVLSVAVGGRAGFAELDVHALADGLYLVRVLSNGEVIGETKCAIAR